jgi:hypothetical protein
MLDFLGDFERQTAVYTVLTILISWIRISVQLAHTHGDNSMEYSGSEENLWR